MGCRTGSVVVLFNSSAQLFCSDVQLPCSLDSLEGEQTASRLCSLSAWLTIVSKSDIKVRMHGPRDFNIKVLFQNWYGV